MMGLQASKSSFLTTFFVSYHIFATTTDVLNVLDDALVSNDEVVTEPGGVLLSLLTWMGVAPAEFTADALFVSASELIQYCRLN